MNKPTLDQPLDCPQCGYDLYGLTAPRCPECGSDVAVLMEAIRSTHTIIDAFRHDAAFYDVNEADDIPWQVELYREQFCFLTTEYHFRLWDRKKPATNPYSSPSLLSWSSRRSRITLWLTDRDRQFVLELSHLVLGVLPWPGASLREVWRLRKGRREVVTADEALRLGREGTQREHILRVADFVRTELRDFLLGDSQVLREAKRARRAFWKGRSSMQSDADAERLWEAAIARRATLEAAQKPVQRSL